MGTLVGCVVGSRLGVLVGIPDGKIVGCVLGEELG